MTNAPFIARCLALALLLSAVVAVVAARPVEATCESQPWGGCYVCDPSNMMSSFPCTWMPAYCDEYPEDKETCEVAPSCNADCQCEANPSLHGCKCDESGCFYDTCTDRPNDAGCKPGCGTSGAPECPPDRPGCVRGLPCVAMEEYDCATFAVRLPPRPPIDGPSGPRMKLILGPGTLPEVC